METTFTMAEGAPNLSTTPWRFALHFYQKIRFAQQYLVVSGAVLVSAMLTVAALFGKHA